MSTMIKIRLARLRPAAIAMSPFTAWLTATVGMGILAAGAVFWRIGPWRGPFGWDEAPRAVAAWQMAQAVRAQDVVRFFAISNDQLLWPPVGPWLMTTFLLILGPSFESARLPFALLLGLSAPLMLVLGHQVIGGRQGLIAGGLAAALLITADLPLETASGIMLELPTICLTLGILASNARALRGEHHYGALTGLLVGVLFITKYNFGGLAALALLLDDFLALRWTKRSYVVRAACLYLPILGVVALWVLTPVDRKLPAVIGYAVDQPNDPYHGLEALLYYLREVVQSHGGVLGWLGWATVPFGLAGGVVAFSRARTSAGVTTILILLGVQFVLSVLHPHKQERYILPTLPLYWLMVGVGAAWIAERFWSRLQLSRGAGLGLKALLVAIVAAHLFTVPFTSIGYAPASASPVVRLLNEVRPLLHPQRSVLILGGFDELGPDLVRWQLQAVTNIPMPALHYDFHELPWVDIPGRVPYDSAPAPQYAERWRGWKATHQGFDVLAIEVADGSPLDTSGYRGGHAWRRNFLMLSRTDPSGELVFERAYPEAGLTVRLYGRSTT